MAVDWPGGVRHVGVVSLICCSRRERGKACPGTGVPEVLGAARGSVPSGDEPVRDLVPIWGVLADRFVVALKFLLGAVGVERRGRVICGVVRGSTGMCLGGAAWTS